MPAELELGDKLQLAVEEITHKQLDGGMPTCVGYAAVQSDLIDCRQDELALVPDPTRRWATNSNLFRA